MHVSTPLSQKVLMQCEFACIHQIVKGDQVKGNTDKKGKKGIVHWETKT